MKSVDKFSRFVRSAKFFLTVDSYIMASAYYQVSGKLSLVVSLWLSGVVVDRTFTSGGVDVRAHAYSLIITA